MENNLRFISSYTKGTIYEEIIHEFLIPSLEKYNLPYHAFEAPDYGVWKINSRQRPLYIKEAMEKFVGENILWIDADARVLQFPSALFKIPNSCHVGVNYLLWSDHYSGSHLKDKVEILDGTSYYSNEAAMRPFMNEWIDRSVKDGKNHRHVLKEMIDEQMEEELRLFLIPREYCYITKQPNGDDPVVPIEKPYIAHYQASRSARNNLYKRS